jgi:hypothetical protein
MATPEQMIRQDGAQSQVQQVAEMAGQGPDPQQMIQEGVSALSAQMGPQQAGQMLMQLGQQLMEGAPDPQRPAQPQGRAGRR